ncbi:MAG: hypothetical protein RR348_04530, partial [Clostridia bacterium]
GTSTIATLSGTVMTFTGVGKVEITVAGADKNVFVQKGVNIAADDVAAFRAAMEKGDDIVLQGDIRFPKGSGMVLKSSIYGNGHGLYLREIIKPELNKKGEVDKKNQGQTAFYISEDSNITKTIVFNGLRMNGNEFDIAAKDPSLVDMEGSGPFVHMGGTDTYTPEISAYNCVFENAHKMFFYRSAKGTFEGCIFKNASDNVLCMQTNGNKGAEMNVKNCAIINSLDAAILFCGWNPTNSQDDFCKLNIEGFLDIYNWKSTSTAKLMPNTEDFASTVNGLVQSEMKKKKYKQFLFEDGTNGTFMHSGIIAIATGGLKQNIPMINGVKMDQNNIDKDTGIWKTNTCEKIKELGFQLRTFPLPGIAKGIAKTCMIVGYGNTKDAKNAEIKPSTKFSTRYEALYNTELREGRVAK